ncbi:hypothetical protein RND81_11G081500 [Saponaria officinalis]|uniref:Uncharacterized protein n=1 Tax=Saponaria officinalis TaxID=3572 RepID=A0AAW1HIE2_SAPOF
MPPNDLCGLPLERLCCANWMCFVVDLEKIKRVEIFDVDVDDGKIKIFDVHSVCKIICRMKLLQFNSCSYLPVRLFTHVFIFMMMMLMMARSNFLSFLLRKLVLDLLRMKIFCPRMIMMAVVEMMENTIDVEVLSVVHGSISSYFI